jgi:hypothetical protein
MKACSSGLAQEKGMPGRQISAIPVGGNPWKCQKLVFGIQKLTLCMPE